MAWLLRTYRPAKRHWFMLAFNFRDEIAGNTVIKRPRLTLRISGDDADLEFYALLDSGADTSIIPLEFANILGLKKGKEIRTSGVGGVSVGYESSLNLSLVGVNGITERISSIPVYVLPTINQFVIGRKKIFDLFKITFEQYNNLILLSNQEEITA